MKETEPTWRQILNWGCVVYFLGLPALAIFYGMTQWTFAPGTQVAKFLSDFHFAVSALVATMAGLNSFERYKTDNKEERRSEQKTFTPA